MATTPHSSRSLSEGISIAHLFGNFEISQPSYRSNSSAMWKEPTVPQFPRAERVPRRRPMHPLTRRRSLSRQLFPQPGSPTDQALYFLLVLLRAHIVPLFV